MEYYSIIRTNEIVVHAIPWMKLGNTMPSERTRHKKTLYEASYMAYNRPIDMQRVESLELGAGRERRAIVS